MLNNYNEGEKFVRGDSYDQIASHLRSVQPRLQKWISQEEEESESEQMDRLLLLNDLVNQVCERHRSFQRGDFSASVHIDPSIDPSKGGAAAVPTAKITDLISFDEEGSSGGGTVQAQGSSSLLDDFEGLSFGGQASASAPSGGGLPADLFDTSNMSQPASQPPPGYRPSTANGAGLTATVPAQDSGSSGLGQWGALQLPVSATSTGGPASNSSSKASASAAKAAPKDPFEDLLG